MTITESGGTFTFAATDTNTDTKNTAGSTNNTEKLYLVGAKSQAANPQTYSNSQVFMTNGTLTAPEVTLKKEIPLGSTITPTKVNFKTSSYNSDNPSYIGGDGLSIEIGVKGNSSQASFDVYKFYHDGSIKWTDKDSHQWLYSLPNKSGTLALLSDIPDAYTKTEADGKYVPYTGASKDVNLGNHSLSISDKTDTSGTMIKVSGKGVSEDDVWTTIEPYGINIASPGIAHAYLGSSALTVTDDAQSGSVTENGFKATTPEGTSVYEYDGIMYNSKKLSFPAKAGTIALTSDLPSKLSQMDNDANYVKSTDNIDADTLAGKTYSQIANMIGQKQDATALLGLIAGIDLSNNSSDNKTGFLRVYMKPIETPGITHYTQVAELQNLPLASSSEYGMVKIDTSLSSSSTNPLQNQAVYSAFNLAVGYDSGYYAYGENGSWRMKQYNTPGNQLDIKYGVITITSQSANYDVSFGKPFNNNNYTVVFGLYRQNKQNWFWSPIVQNKAESGFKVFVQGNSGGDNGGTLMYIAIRSN